MLDKKVISILIISFALSLFIGRFTYISNSNALYKQLFITKVYTHKKFNVIIAGDSRVYRNISPKIIGDNLNLKAFNLGFSSAGFSQPLFDLIEDKLAQKGERKIIILGITPYSLTKKAGYNRHLRRLQKIKKEEIIENLYLMNFKNLFTVTSPIKLWNKVFLHNNYKNNYQQIFHIDEGWVESWYIKPNENKALASYKKTLSETKIDSTLISNLYNKIKQWREQKILVYGYINPVTDSLKKLERELLKFNDVDFIKRFKNAGGKWIYLKGNYTTYDGSHLDKESARRLSLEIAREIKKSFN